MSSSTASVPSVSRKAAVSTVGSFVFSPLVYAQTSAQTASPQIVLAAPANDAAGNMLYAVDLGLYEKAGLNVKVTALANPGPLIAAVVSGSVTIAGLPITAAAIARENGIPIVIIAPLALYVRSKPTNALIVLKNSSLQKAADLNGKIIAVRELANMAYFGAKLWIDKNGGDSRTVRWIEIPDTQALAAMQVGRIDAASVSEPALDTAVHGDARMLGRVFDAIADRFLIGGCVASEEFAKAHPDIVRKFADVIAATSKWANADPIKSGQILEKYAQAPVLPGSTRYTYAERLRAADVQPVLDVMVNYGLLKAPMRARALFSSLIPTS